MISNWRSLAASSAVRLLPAALALAAPLVHAAADPCGWVFFQSGFEAGDVEPPSGHICLRGRLNDSGVTFCSALDGNLAECSGNEPGGQDAQYGRDALAVAGQLSKVGGGDAGFDFSKVSNSGALLPAEAELGAGAEDWACTRDNVTGLVWEVKVDDPAHLRHMGHGYTWYDPNSPDGNPGSVGSIGSCGNTLAGSTCNTLNYVQMVNGQELCGAGDWRMPSGEELQGIVDYGKAGPAIDGGYFPNTPSSFFWTVSPSAFGTDYAVFVLFDSGIPGYYARNRAYRVRLVRDGQ